jgi:hypothetical protein
MTKRVALALAAVVVAAGSWAPARAQEPILLRWSTDFETPSYSASSLIVRGTVHYDSTVPAEPPVPPQAQILSVTVVLAPITTAAPDGCEGELSVTELYPPPDAPGPHSVSFRAKFEPPCNGTYRATVTAVAGTPPDEPAGQELSPAFVLDALALAVAPAPVTSLDASVQPERVVGLAWTPPPAPPDLVGYVIERSDQGGPFFVVGGTPPTTSVYADAALPTAGGVLVYRVRAARSGATDATLVYSSAVASDTASVSVAPASTASSSTSTSVTGTSLPTGPGPTAGGSGLPSPVPVPGVTGSTLPSGIAPAIPEPLSRLPLPPEGSLALDSDDGPSDPARGKGLLVPFAAGLVLFVWAMHLRALARLAKRES